MIRLFLLIGGLLSSTYSFDITAREFKGHISVKLILDDQSQYFHGRKFKTNDQRLTSSVIANSINEKPSDRFDFELTILEEKDDYFKAAIKIYENGVSKNDLKRIRSEVIYYPIEGKLFANNEFQFSSENSPKLMLKLFVDKIFSLEEIKQRFEKKPANNQ